MTEVEAGEVVAKESEKEELGVQHEGVNNIYSCMYNYKHSHLWMDQGCQNNSVIQGYSDRGWQIECLAMDGPGMSE